MQNLSILETCPHEYKIGADLIKRIEGTKHSHVAISWKDYEKGIRYVAEARGGGIRIITNHAFKKDNKVINLYTSEIEDLALVEVERYIWNVIAHDYSRLQLLGLAEMRLMNGLYRSCGSDYRRGNRFRDGDYSQICVELGIKAVEIANSIKVPGDLENYGLREGSMIFTQYMKKQTQEKVDRINAHKG